MALRLPDGQLAVALEAVNFLEAQGLDVSRGVAALLNDVDPAVLAESISRAERLALESNKGFSNSAIYSAIKKITELISFACELQKNTDKSLDLVMSVLVKCRALYSGDPESFVQNLNDLLVIYWPQSDVLEPVPFDDLKIPDFLRKGA